MANRRCKKGGGEHQYRVVPRGECKVIDLWTTEGKQDGWLCTHVFECRKCQLPDQKRYPLCPQAPEKMRQVHP